MHSSQLDNLAPGSYRFYLLNPIEFTLDGVNMQSSLQSLPHSPNLWSVIFHVNKPTTVYAMADNFRYEKLDSMPIVNTPPESLNKIEFLKESFDLTEDEIKGIIGS